MPLDLILGTAGHIDHGKTALVKALTGVDTDRLPEEKRRGITIELGFAQLVLGKCRLGVVDVPGHERFVKTMLAGATGIDLALLAVAADDSIKPQTREHLEILRFLDLRAGVIALTKCDLPDPSWMDLVEEEVRDLVRGTFLADAPIVRTSVAKGQGIPQLREALAAAANVALAQRNDAFDGPFRMAIDRTFTVAGYGTVVTGSVAAGRARIGDELCLEPGGIRARVRGLQHHDRPVDHVLRGQRAAVNLAGVHHEEIERGQELATPGHLTPSRRFGAQIRLLPTAQTPLRNRAHVRCHLGTAELMATVSLLDRDQLERGDSALAVLRTQAPAVAVWGQPLVLRSESPVSTIGGGHVLDPAAARIKRGDSQAIDRLRSLTSNEELVRAAAAIYFFAWRDWKPGDLSRAAGITATNDLVEELIRRGDVRTLEASPTRSIRVHRDVLENAFERLASAIAARHDREPLRTTTDPAPLMSQFAYLGSESVVEAILAEMARDGRLIRTDRGVALPDRGPRLSAGERKLLAQLVEQYRIAGAQPPSIGELTANAIRNRAAVPQLLALAVADGDLVEVSPELLLHADADRAIRAQLKPQFAERGLTVSQIREILGVSRKYAVPICEYLDRTGFTRREGDRRMLAEPAPIEPAARGAARSI